MTQQLDAAASRVRTILTSREGLAMPRLAKHIAERSDLTVEEAIGALRAAQIDDLNNKQRARHALN